MTFSDGAAWVAAIAATATLLLMAWDRHVESIRRRTQITAWAEPATPGADILEGGAKAWVRNGTGVAAQGVQLVVHPRRPSKRSPDSPANRHYATVPVPWVIPPGATVEVPIPAILFGEGEGPTDHHLIAEIIFQDALGQWWWRTGSGRLIRSSLRRTPSDSAPPTIDESWTRSSGWRVWHRWTTPR